MVAIRVNCPMCAGSCELESTRVIVALAPVPTTDATAELLFACVSCRSAVVLTVATGLGAVLVAHGATPLPSLDVSALLPPGHPEQPPGDAPPLTRDDLLDLHERLQDGRALSAFLSRERA